MKNLAQILQFADIIFMVVLIIMIALQNKSSGLSGVFGNAGNIVQTRRGFEKWLFYATIVCGIIFLGISVSLFLVKRA